MIMLTGRDKELHARCKSCGKTESMLVNPSDVADWQEGEYIQDAMPYLSVSEREILISGICGICFDNIMPPMSEN